MTTWEVTLERRRLGSAFGTTFDVVEADTPDEAELKAILAWSTQLASVGFEFAPLLTIERTGTVIVLDPARPRGHGRLLEREGRGDELVTVSS